MALNSGVLSAIPLIVPDTRPFLEALKAQNGGRSIFAVIMNEYALVVGIITLNDVMTIMGDPSAVTGRANCGAR